MIWRRIKGACFKFN